MARRRSGFPEYASVAEKKQKARRQLEKYQATHPGAKPVTIQGTKIASSFWGKAWCKHLKYYADYDNRIPRGRAYLKNGFVFDLFIQKGAIHGVVYGSGDKLYDVSIHMDPIEDQRLIEQIGGHIENLEELAQGKFPKSLEKEFLTEENGLFPRINEIQLNCTCPDSAKMCKHISAILYAVGARLDAEPLLLFELRDIDTSALIKKSVEEKMNSLLENANSTKSNRVIDDDSVLDEFDLE
ncbi:SWIM zinc finger family protein [Tetragenococcus koreensis]|uniref:SWIM zinc finger family protein n=1 Tax=Tetragenococcus koreensis TaxID=290335 RepID=UPI000F509E36|nr:SWIM zinc finger family protein [Tetragenococcus koreensis]AYW46541.1 hypothetical protein C7K43_11760 [Tetragenococcus koreensis]GEN92097.1 hypothetical protein TKO01_21430 [Tetragenococcus koreensis]